MIAIFSTVLHKHKNFMCLVNLKVSVPYDAGFIMLWDPGQARLYQMLVKLYPLSSYLMLQEWNEKV